MTQNDLFNEFLSELEHSAPRTTYQTHRCLVDSLAQFFPESDRNAREISPDDVATFVRSEWDDFHQATINGKLSSLGNILGYLWHEDPAVCKRKVVVALDDQLNEESDWTIPTQALTGSERILVEILRDWLRQYQYATRLHTVVELMLDTRARPSVVHRIDRGDIDQQEGVVTVSFPETHALGQYRILETRSVELSPVPHDVLKTYHRYNRQTPAAGDKNALFTTSFGRVSRSTLSRDCRTASEKIQDILTQDEVVEQYPTLKSGIIYENVSLRQIWVYSLDTITHSDT